jgi:predicted MFS family arabinose efflux permease
MGRERPELGTAALLLYAGSATAMLASSAMSPVLPAIQGTFGVSDARIGLVMSAFTLSVALSVPVVGWLADRLGRRPVLGGSLVLFGLSGLGTFFAPDFTTVLALRALQGVGFGGILPLAVAVIGDLFDGSAEVGAQGYRVTAVNLGGFLFPVATGALVAVAWNVPFLLFAMAFPVALAVFAWLPEPTEDTERPEGNYARAVLTAARRPIVAIAVAIGTLRFFTLYALYAYLPLLITGQGLSAGQVGVVIGVISALKMLVATQSRRSLAVGPPRVTLGIALVASLVAVAAFSLADTFLTFALVAGTLGAIEGITAPLQKTVLTRYAPVNVRAGVVSANASAQNLGKTAGPIAVGLAVTVVSIPAAMVGLGIGGAVVAVALLGATLAIGAPAEGDDMNGGATPDVDD